jgi:hypothetical protein
MFPSGAMLCCGDASGGQNSGVHPLLLDCIVSWSFTSMRYGLLGLYFFAQSLDMHENHMFWNNRVQLVTIMKILVDICPKLLKTSTFRRQSIWSLTPKWNFRLIHVIFWKNWVIGSQTEMRVRKFRKYLGNSCLHEEAANVKNLHLSS